MLGRVQAEFESQMASRNIKTDLKVEMVSFAIGVVGSEKTLWFYQELVT